MIYLNPIGGLCNRIRTIDSLISLCKIYKKDLTVLWVKDASLNCSFKDLYTVPKFDEFSFEVIDCPVGFPMNYIRNSATLKLFGNSDAIESHLTRSLKNILKGRFLDHNLRAVLKSLQQMTKNRIITNEDLTILYGSEKYNEDTLVSDMDANFIPIVAPMLIPLLSDTTDSVYISSCYRLHPLENPYIYFSPILEILDKVEKTTANFNNTVGLHIRRSDHKASKAVSTTDKFVEIAYAAIETNPETTFFLSTDDEITKKELMNEFGKKIIVNEVSSYDRNTSKAVIDAMVDLYCLSKTQKIYGSHHSSFSQTAADIGMVKEITAK